MINPHKIIQSLKHFVKWLIVTNYGRFSLGILLCFFGIFSEQSTISFLSTDYIIFTYAVNAGVTVIIGQFIWTVTRAIYLWIYNSNGVS